MVISPRPDSRAVTAVCCYAPTLQRSTVNPQEADNFYELLNNVVLRTKNRDELWILGDLNAKVGSSRPGSVNPAGCCSKHTISNSNGSRLVEFCEDNRLVLTNRLFKHRMQHRSTWFSDGLVHADGKPVRNMIDYVIVKRFTMAAVLDARSFGGFTTRSDHHPVIAVLGIALSKVHPPVKQQDPFFNRYNHPTAESSKLFCDRFKEKLPSLLPLSANIDNDFVDKAWRGFVWATHDAAQDAFGKVPTGSAPKASTNPRVASLSTEQKNLHCRINAEPDPEQRKALKIERSGKVHEI
ncbi:craniofacial development protein 2-like [Sycon ciliatum]|uniref:craniofacial development protein 2-like n=1 Tax=Sycon ciliatum TaxID=27933 RepID=UPI0031F71045